MEKHSLSGLNTQPDERKNMMEDCELEYDNVAYWNVFDVWENIAAAMIFIFVLFALAGIYTKERSSNMNYVLCTARTGYFRIIADKWFAGCILGVGSILLVNINLFTACILCGSSSGYDANIVNLGAGLVYTPYNMAIWESCKLHHSLYYCVGLPHSIDVCFNCKKLS